MEREGLQAVNAWIQAFNRIGKSESNFHSFELLRGGDSVTATLVLQGIESSGTCLMGPYALASISLVGDKVSLKLASGNYQRCGQGPDETAERRETVARQGDRPRQRPRAGQRGQVREDRG